MPRKPKTSQSGGRTESEFSDDNEGPAIEENTKQAGGDDHQNDKSNGNQPQQGNNKQKQSPKPSETNGNQQQGNTDISEKNGNQQQQNTSEPQRWPLFRNLTQSEIWMACVFAFLAVLFMIVLYVKLPNQNEIDEIRQELHKMKTEHGKDFTEEISNLNYDLANLKEGLKREKNDAVRLKQNLDTLNEDMHRLNALEKSFEIQSDKFVKIKHDTQIKLDGVSDKLNKTTQELMQGLEEQNKTLHMEISEGSDRKARLDKTKEQVDEMSSKLETLRDNSKRHADTLKTLEDKVDQYDITLKDQAEAVRKDIESSKESLKNFNATVEKMMQKVKTHEKDLDTAFDNLFNKDFAVKVIFVICMVNFALIIAVCILCQRIQKSGSYLSGPGQTSPVGNYNMDTLAQIPQSPTLQRAVCVVSFSREYQPCHRRLLESVTALMESEGDTVAVEYHVILTDKDIPEIPRCRLIVICVEFSDRDVIIEQSGYGLGSLNKTTLAAVYKLGATPAIIYCKDLRSRNLGDKLFHPGIRCATQQEELRPLSAGNQFFSVYDDFTQKQKDAFKVLVKRHL